MDAIEAVAVVIIIFAILVLVYYFIKNSPELMNKFQSYNPSYTSSFSDNMNSNNTNYEKDSIEEEIELDEDNSVGKKIKIKLSDIDMSSLNTDAFSKKIDAFLDEKSDQLIQEWSLATKNDLGALEDKFDKTSQSVDDLEERFNKFKKSSDKKFDKLDKRIKALENK